MTFLLGIGTLLTWIIADIWLGIKIYRQDNLIYKSLLISVNIVVVIFAILLFYI
jgi:hypothetical protein